MLLYGRFFGEFTGQVVIKGAAAAACMFVLAGCSQTIDGSNRDAYKASVESITADMDSAEKVKFIVAAATACPLTLQAGQPTFVDDSCLQVLDGKTVEDVDRMADINRLKLRLKKSESMLEIYQGHYEHTPANPEQAARYAAEVADIKAELKSLGDSMADAPAPVEAALTPAVVDKGSDAECVAGTNDAPEVGARYNDGIYLCRESVEGGYWNDWYGIPVAGVGFDVKSDGKTGSFEGVLKIDCSTGQADWSSASNFGVSVDTDAEVPSLVVASARSIFCRT